MASRQNGERARETQLLPTNSGVYSLTATESVGQNTHEKPHMRKQNAFDWLLLGAADAAVPQADQSPNCQMSAMKAVLNADESASSNSQRRCRMRQAEVIRNKIVGEYGAILEEAVKSRRKRACYSTTRESSSTRKKQIAKRQKAVAMGRMTKVCAQITKVSTYRHVRVSMLQFLGSVSRRTLSRHAYVACRRPHNKLRSGHDGNRSNRGIST